MDYHAPLKQKSVRGNRAPFMTREPCKTTMIKSKVKNSYEKWPSRENFVAYKKAKNQSFFKEATKGGVMSNRAFWKTVKPFLKYWKRWKQDDATFNGIISKYSAHPSVYEIKKEFFSDEESELAYANDKHINQIIRSPNVNKWERCRRNFCYVRENIDRYYWLTYYKYYQ